MDPRRVLAVLLAVAGAGLLAAVLLPGLLVGDPGSYDSTTVTTYDENGTRLATVTVRVADTDTKRRVGLSETDTLGSDEGMLFVHEREARHTYVMSGPRERMSFDLDIVFLDASGTVTEIHHAARNASGNFPGRGRYVLEVNRGWTNRTGLDVGDTVRVPEGVGG